MKYRNNIKFKGKSKHTDRQTNKNKTKSKETKQKQKNQKNMLKHSEPGHRNVTQDLTVSK